MVKNFGKLLFLVLSSALMFVACAEDEKEKGRVSLDPASFDNFSDFASQRSYTMPDSSVTVSFDNGSRLDGAMVDHITTVPVAVGANGLQRTVSGGAYLGSNGSDMAENTVAVFSFKPAGVTPTGYFGVEITPDGTLNMTFDKSSNDEPELWAFASSVEFDNGSVAVANSIVKNKLPKEMRESGILSVGYQGELPARGTGIDTKFVVRGNGIISTFANDLVVNDKTSPSALRPTYLMNEGTFVDNKTAFFPVMARVFAGTNANPKIVGAANMYYLAMEVADNDRDLSVLSDNGSFWSTEPTSTDVEGAENTLPTTTFIDYATLKEYNVALNLGSTNRSIYGAGVGGASNSLVLVDNNAKNTATQGVFGYAFPGNITGYYGVEYQDNDTINVFVGTDNKSFTAADDVVFTDSSKATLALKLDGAAGFSYADTLSFDPDIAIESLSSTIKGTTPYLLTVEKQGATDNRTVVLREGVLGADEKFTFTEVATEALVGATVAKVLKTAGDDIVIVSDNGTQAMARYYENGELKPFVGTNGYITPNIPDNVFDSAVLGSAIYTVAGYDNKTYAYKAEKGGADVGATGQGTDILTGADFAPTHIDVITVGDRVYTYIIGPETGAPGGERYPGRLFDITSIPGTQRTWIGTFDNATDNISLFGYNDYLYLMSLSDNETVIYKYDHTNTTNLRDWDNVTADTIPFVDTHLNEVTVVGDNVTAVGNNKVMVLALNSEGKFALQTPDGQSNRPNAGEPFTILRAFGFTVIVSTDGANPSGVMFNQITNTYTGPDPQAP